MRIVFVRHGEPDYEHDCLTETGRLQAQAAAEPKGWGLRLRRWNGCTRSPGAGRAFPRTGIPGR